MTYSRNGSTNKQYQLQHNDNRNLTATDDIMKNQTITVQGKTYTDISHLPHDLLIPTLVSRANEQGKLRYVHQIYMDALEDDNIYPGDIPTLPILQRLDQIEEDMFQLVSQIRKLTIGVKL